MSRVNFCTLGQTQNFSFALPQSYPENPFLGTENEAIKGRSVSEREPFPHEHELHGTLLCRRHPDPSVFHVVAFEWSSLAKRPAIKMCRHSCHTTQL